MKLFIDMNISIPGSPKKQYGEYMNNIRKEHSIYTGTQYKKGELTYCIMYQTWYSFTKQTFSVHRLNRMRKEIQGMSLQF